MPNTRPRLRPSRTAGWLLTLLAVAAASAPPSLALSVIDRGDLSVQLIPLDVIQLNPCPPRCAANTYARLHPSLIYKPLEPDEIVFDGATSLIWGTSAGSEWLVWGRSEGPTITVWDETMWVEDVAIDARAIGDGPKSKYGISKEMRISDVRPRRARGAVAGSRREERSMPGAETSEIGNLDDIPPELLTPIERGWLANLLERLSQSQYAVGAVTLRLMALMARLVR